MTRAREREQGRTARDQAPAAEPGLFNRTKLVAGLAALAVLVIFLLSNLQRVEVRFLGLSWDTRMVWALLAASLIGALGAVMFGTISRRRRQR